MMRKRLRASLIYKRQALISIMCAKKLSSKINVAFILLTLTLSVSCSPDSSSNDHSTWTQYGGSPDQSKYFEATQITKENVSQMKVAWMYPTGDNNFYFFSPIVVDTTMYVMAKNYSLDCGQCADSGKEIWIHANLQGLSRRGLNYWESKDKKDKRLIFTLNNTLQAIDAVTGKSIITFGDSGYVDMRVRSGP